MNLLVNVRLYRICVGVTGEGECAGRMRQDERFTLSNLLSSLASICGGFKGIFSPPRTLLRLSLNLKPALPFGGENVRRSEALSRPLCQ